MKKVKLGLFGLSAFGLVLSLITHISFYSDLNIQDLPISPFLLHIGIFIVFIPSLILFIIENKNNKDPDGRVVPMKTLYEGVPKPLLILVFVFYIYAIFNFLFFMGSMNGSPMEKDGKYFLSNHGTILKELTIEEYQSYRRLVVKGFSGHWMLFYVGAILLSYPFRKLKENTLLEKERPIVNQLELPVVSFGARLFEKGQFLFILAGISIPLFIFFLFFSPHIFLLAVTGIFPLNLIFNLYFFIKWSKFYIQSYSIKNNQINLSVYKFNELVQYTFPLDSIQVKVNKKYLRGSELTYLSFYDTGEEEIFSQYESSKWSPNLLGDLERAFYLAQQ